MRFDPLPQGVGFLFEVSMIALLGARSTFSLGQSLLDPEDIVKFAAENGYSAVSLTDITNVSAMVRFSKACAKHNIKPIIGTVLRLFDDAFDKTPKKKRETPNHEWHLKVYAKNETGIQSIYALLSLASTEDHFYYVPRLHLNDVLLELHKGGLVISSGDFYGAFSHAEGVSQWRTLTTALGGSQAFLELCPVQTPLFDTVNEKVLREHQETGCPVIVSRPSLYFKDDDTADTLDILSTICTNGKLSNPWRSVPYVRDFTLNSIGDFAAHIERSYVSIKSRFPHSPDTWLQGLQNSAALAELCEYRWGKQPISLPNVTSGSERDALIAGVLAGWNTRLTVSQLGYRPTDLAPYAERLKYEIDTLVNMGFERYFLLIQDLVRWAKDNGIYVGPGRGSVGGSLVAYLMGITDVDPIRFDLIFERFINPERLDLPDIDLDFMTSGRQRCVDYLINTYGRDCVAGITNYSTLASASALRDTARVSELPLAAYECTKLVPKVHGKSHELNKAAEEVPEIEAFRTAFPDIWRHSVRLQGKMRAYGTHAAGICVAGEPIIHRAPVITRAGFPVVAFDKREVEDQGLIKADLLGLSTLDILRIAIGLIKKTRGEQVDLLRVALDDPRTLDAFGQGQTQGVFQFESSGMRKLLKDLALNSPLTFDDLAAATALYRPGPMDSGLMDDYVAVRQGRRAISYDHPNMQAALKATHGIIIFQENVMQVARDLAGFSMAQADKLRKAMGKKDPVAMAKERDRFVAGCADKSAMNSYHAGILFDKIEKFAGYSFNRSHAVEYSIISFWSMWLKKHYPAEFYAASMSILDSDKLPGLVKDAEADGILVVGPDINISTDIFEPTFGSGGWKLVAPFNRINGIGEKTGAAIMSARTSVGGRFVSVDQFLNVVPKRACNSKHQGILREVGAYDSVLMPSEIVTGEVKKRALMQLLPGVMNAVMSATRMMSSDAQTKELLAQAIQYPIFGCADPNDEKQWLTEPCSRCSFGGASHVPPRHGRTPKVMLITDSPTFGEDANGKMVEGLGSDYLKEAIKAGGLTIADFYVTTLVKSKRPKGVKQLTNEQINACSGFLDKEIEILRPQLILACGSATIRHLLKGVKGSADELIGYAEYDAARDCTIVCGMSPQMIYIKPEKQGVLNDVLKQVAEILAPNNAS